MTPLIKTDPYLLIVNNRKPKDTEFCFILNRNNRIAFYGEGDGEELLNGMKGIIYAHLPLNNAPKLEGVLLMSPLDGKDEDSWSAKDYLTRCGIDSPFLARSLEALVMGAYKEAKASKGGYTKEQMRIMYDVGAVNIDKYGEAMHNPDTDFANCIQSLTNYPIGVEIEIEACDQCDGCGWYEGGATIKTTCQKCNGKGGQPKIIGDTLQVKYCYNQKSET